MIDLPLSQDPGNTALSRPRANFVRRPRAVREPFLCAGLRHSLLYAPSPAVAGGEPQLSHPAAISAFGLARHGQLGISVDRLPHSGGLVQVPVPVVVGRARHAFKPPVLRGSALVKHFYGALRPDRLAALPEEERLRVLVSLGEAHAWRLPPSHPMYRPAP